MTPRSMMNFTLPALIIIMALMSCQSVPRSDDKLTHMLRLMCGTSQENIEKHSRVAVIRTADPDYDYGLTTGHGVPEDRPCIVRDFEGRLSSVISIQYAPDYKSGTPTDWAILKFKPIKTPGLVRFEMEPTEFNPAINGMEVNFAKAFALPENFQHCQLELLDLKSETPWVSHNCRSIPGQSGSPVSITKDGKEKLIGLNIGTIWLVQNPNTGRPSKNGYLFLLNAATVQKIENTIQDLS